MNIKIFDVKYDFDLILKSYLSQSSINLKSEIKNKFMKHPVSLCFFSYDDNDYEEEKEINTNRENISKYTFPIVKKNQ